MKNGTIIKDLGGEHIAKSYGRCIACNRITWGYVNDPCPDWRGPFGDSTHSVFEASGYDMEGLDVTICTYCENTRERNELGLARAKKQWTPIIHGALPKQSVSIIGRRWFQRGPGNTYCTASIYVDGVCIHKLPARYGYGSYYAQAAEDWLDQHGFMPGRVHYKNGSKEPGWQFFRDKHGINYSTEAIDVQREKDL
jgi:hypothetical protein